MAPARCPCSAEMDFPIFCLIEARCTGTVKSPAAKPGKPSSQVHGQCSWGKREPGRPAAAGVRRYVDWKRLGRAAPSAARPQADGGRAASCKPEWMNKPNNGCPPLPSYASAWPSSSPTESAPARIARSAAISALASALKSDASGLPHFACAACSSRRIPRLGISQASRPR
jgi:hypothetical protein